MYQIRNGYMRFAESFDQNRLVKVMAFSQHK